VPTHNEPSGSPNAHTSGSSTRLSPANNHKNPVATISSPKRRLGGRATAHNPAPLKFHPINGPNTAQILRGSTPSLERPTPLSGTHASWNRAST
jgi:hypothetical protein